MNNKEKEKLRQVITANVNKTELDSYAERRVFAAISQELEGGHKIMRINSKKLTKTAAAVCAIMVMGTITAVAEGKIVGLSTSQNLNEAVHSADELVQKAEKQMGSAPTLLDTFSNGLAFNKGYISNVTGTDEEGNTTLTYPSLYAYYGDSKQVSLSVNAHQDAISLSDTEPKARETYGNTVLESREDNYLFLPEDVSPSEEDLKLQEEGKLLISYGTSEEQRQVSRSVRWSENGLDYSLASADGLSCEELAEIAKEMIDKK